MAAFTIGYLVGSLASNSINRTLSRAPIRLAPDDLEFTAVRRNEAQGTAIIRR